VHRVEIDTHLDYRSVASELLAARHAPANEVG